MALLGEDDAARCSGQGLRSMATGGWHDSVGIGAARSKVEAGAESENECEVEKMKEDSPWAHAREDKASAHVGWRCQPAVTYAGGHSSVSTVTAW
jgi:hypothetical protein